MYITYMYSINNIYILYMYIYKQQIKYTMDIISGTYKKRTRDSVINIFKKNIYYLLRKYVCIYIKYTHAYTRVSCSHCDKQKFIVPLSAVARIDVLVVIVIIIVTIRT